MWEGDRPSASRQIKRYLIVKGLTEQEREFRRYSKGSESHFKIYEESDNSIAVASVEKGVGRGTAWRQTRREVYCSFPGVYALGPSYETGTVVGTGNGTEVVSTLMNPRE